MEKKRGSGALDTPLLLLLTVAAGLSIGNLYWAQPLLASIAEYFGKSAAEGGFLITVTQTGYALGILLIIPLGDFLQRKVMIPLLMSTTALFLLAGGLSPSFHALSLFLALMGFTTVTGQVIIPLVGDLAPEHSRGKMIGIVSSGITSGILLARFFSGLVADMFGWRAIYFMAAAFNIALLMQIMRRIPATQSRRLLPYHRMIASVFSTASHIPALPWLVAVSGLSFCVFNMFWVSLTLLLSFAPFNYSTLQIGLVSLAGFSGAIVAQGVGKLMDKGIGVQSIGAFTALMGLGMLCSFFSGASILLAIIAAAIVSIASQGVMILTQTTLFSLAAEARSRVNTVFVVGNFIFAAAGSALASFLWRQGGLSSVTLSGMAICFLGLLSWFSAKGKMTA